MQGQQVRGVLYFVFGGQGVGDAVDQPMDVGRLRAVDENLGKGTFETLGQTVDIAVVHGGRQLACAAPPLDQFCDELAEEAGS